MNRATTALFALAVACIVGSAAAAVVPSPQAVQRTLPPPVPMTTAQKNALLAAKKRHILKSDSGETFSMSRLSAGQGYLDAYNVAYLSSAGIVLDGSQAGAVATLWYQPTGRAREHLVVWTLNADGPGTVQLSDDATGTSIVRRVHGGSAHVAALLPAAGPKAGVLGYEVQLRPKSTVRFTVREVSIQEVE